MRMSFRHIERYESVRRLLSSVAMRRHGRISESTKTTFLFFINRFCEFVGKNPDELIKERLKHMKSDDIFERRRHEELVMQFAIHLQNQGYSPNTIATAVGSIRAFYRANYMPLTEVYVPPANPERECKVPTPIEFMRAYELTENKNIKAFILLDKDCGISIQDLLSLTPEDGSPIYGSIREQVRRGEVPIHVQITRKKTGIKYDTFFGEEGYMALNEHLDLSKPKLFKVGERSIQYGFKRIAEKLGWKGFTPYSCRKFFKTYLSMAGVNEAVVEYMMGHSLGKVRGAYFIPPVDELRKIYSSSYDKLRILLSSVARQA